MVVLETVWACDQGARSRRIGVRFHSYDDASNGSQRRCPTQHEARTMDLAEPQPSRVEDGGAGALI